MLVLLALPLIEFAWPYRPGLPRRRLRAAAVPAVLLLLAVVFTAGGLLANREGATDARQEMLVYSVDADTGHAYWASGRAPVSEWSRSLLSEPAAPIDDAFAWSGGWPLWHGPAPAGFRHEHQA